MTIKISRRNLLISVGIIGGAIITEELIRRTINFLEDKKKFEKAYVIYNDNGIIKAYNSKGDLEYKGKEAAEVINRSLNSLREYRVFKEYIEIRGDFSLESTINLPSNIYLEINGILRSMDKNYDLINIENQSDIEIKGGELIGYGAEKGTTGWGIRTLGNKNQNNNIIISGVYAHDFKKSGIAVNKSEFGCIVGNCRCDHNGLNGIGFGDINNFTAINNRCGGNLDTGLNIEDGWDFTLIDNICTENVRHNLQLEHGVRGKIIRGTYSESKELYGISIRNRAIGGRENEKSQEVDILDVSVDSNALSGLLIQSSDRINVYRGTYKNNGQKQRDDGIRIIDDGINLSNNNTIQETQCYDDQKKKTQNYGIQEINGDYNIIKNNIVRDNIMDGIKNVGKNTIVSDNIL